MPCFLCHGPSTRLVTRTTNRNGNGGRPYDKCVPCGKFLGFADERGNDPRNPPCECGVPSKRQVTGYRNKTPRAVHYVCRLRRCDFYAELRDGSDGERVVVDERLLALLAKLAII